MYDTYNKKDFFCFEYFFQFLFHRNKVNSFKKISSNGFPQKAKETKKHLTSILIKNMYKELKDRVNVVLDLEFRLKDDLFIDFFIQMLCPGFYEGEVTGHKGLP